MNYSNGKIGIKAIVKKWYLDSSNSYEFNPLSLPKSNRSKQLMFYWEFSLWCLILIIIQNLLSSKN
jgi:hypothetical protein